MRYPGGSAGVGVAVGPFEPARASVAADAGVVGVKIRPAVRPQEIRRAGQAAARIVAGLPLDEDRPTGSPADEERPQIKEPSTSTLKPILPPITGSNPAPA